MKITLPGGRAIEHRVRAQDLANLLTHVQNLTIDLGRFLAGATTSEEIIEESCRLEVVIPVSPGSVHITLELEHYSEVQPNVIGERAIVAASEAIKKLKDPDFRAEVEYGEEVVAEIYKIGMLAERYDRVDIESVTNSQHVVAVIDRDLLPNILGVQAPSLQVKDVTIKGILYALADTPIERDRSYFKAELYTETKETWSVRFSREFSEIAGQMWDKYVQLSGQATYYRGRRPLISVKNAQPIQRANWEETLRRAAGAGKEIFGDIPFDDLIKDLR